MLVIRNITNWLLLRLVLFLLLRLGLLLVLVLLRLVLFLLLRLMVVVMTISWCYIIVMTACIDGAATIAATT